MSVTVCTGTYGEDSWIELAHERAWASVRATSPKTPWIHAHRETLHEARNVCLASVETEFVIHLDADDALGPGYIEAMKAGSADVRAPMIRFVDGDRPRKRLWRPHVSGHKHICEAECLVDGNWIACGAMARTQLLRDVGGWDDFPIYEDWDLWLRCHLAGASFEWRDEAVYWAYVNRNGRNRGPTRAEKLRAHREIAEANQVPVP